MAFHLIIYSSLEECNNYGVMNMIKSGVGIIMHMPYVHVRDLGGVPGEIHSADLQGGVPGEIHSVALPSQWGSSTSEWLNSEEYQGEIP